MKITVCGSIQFESRMAEVGDELARRGYEVERPSLAHGGGGSSVEASLKRQLMDEHFAKIDASEAILVMNESKNGIDHYIGANTLIEMSYAFAQGLDIFLINPVPDMNYADEIRGMQPIILNGDLDAIDRHIESLPLVYMSTTSRPKQLGVSRAFRRYGVPVRVEGVKHPSGVAEQPMTIEETHDGAVNRHKNLVESGVAADYFVTVESGMHPLHNQHNEFGCIVFIVQKGDVIETGINVDVEFPQELMDGVPDKYADVGVLIKEKYGHHEKDPYPFFTNGALTRSKIIEDALYRVLNRRKDLTYGKR